MEQVSNLLASDLLNEATKNLQPYLGKNDEHYEQVKPVLLEKYGFDDLDKWQVNELERAEKELAACDGCTGQCQKSDNQHLVPVIRNINGLNIAYAYCKYGEQRRITSLCRKASIPAKYADKTFANYDITADNKRAVDGAKWFTQLKPSRGLYLHGEAGTGKTFLASITAREYVKLGYNVIFGDVPALMNRLKATFDTGGTEELLDRYSKCDLLVLDDLGVGQITDWRVGIIYQIINTRYNAQRPIIATSNYDLCDLETVLSKSDEFTGRRITSRLREMTYQLYLGDNDRRQQQC